MATSDVIAGLVRSLQPVTPLAVPSRRFTRWAASAAVVAVAVVLALGPRPDLLLQLTSLTFMTHVALLMLAAGGSAWAALVLAAPGERFRFVRRAMPVGAAAAWVAWLCVELISQASGGGRVWPVVGGWGCVAEAFAVGAVPGVIILRMVGRGAPTELRPAMTLAVLAGCATGALGVEATCPVGHPLHVLIWHAGPLVIAVAAAALFSPALLVGARRAERLPQ